MLFPDEIMHTVEKKYRLNKGDIISPKRQKTVSDARSIAMYLARKLTTLSLNEIAWWFERKDHTTIIHNCKKVIKCMKTNPKSQLSMATKDIIDSLMETDN